MNLFIFFYLQLCVLSEALTCDPGYFGLKCEGVCRCMNGNQLCDKLNGNCADNMCSIGYRSPPSCQQVCKNNTFGLGCGEECHCLPGDYCYHVNGQCGLNECNLGWGGAACQKKLPFLKSPPIIDIQSNGSTDLTWPAFKEGVSGSGNDSIHEYILQCRENGRDVWMNVDKFLHNLETDVLRVNLSKRSYMWLWNMEIKCRILLSYFSGKKLKSTNYALPTKFFKINCQKPSLPEIISIISLEELNILKILWKNKENKSSNCQFFKYYELSIFYEYLNSSTLIKINVNIENSFDFVFIKQNLSRYRKVGVTMKAYNNAGMASNQTKFKYFDLFEHKMPLQNVALEFKVADDYFVDQVTRVREIKTRSNFVLFEEMNLIGRNESCLIIKVVDVTVCDLKNSLLKNVITVIDAANEKIINATTSYAAASLNQLKLCMLKESAFYHIIADCSQQFNRIMFLTAATGFKINTPASLNIKMGSSDMEILVLADRLSNESTILILVDKSFDNLEQIFNDDNMLVEDKRLDQQYLFDYETSAILGLSYYVTAELTVNSSKKKKVPTATLR